MYACKHAHLSFSSILLNICYIIPSVRGRSKKDQTTCSFSEVPSTSRFHDVFTPIKITAQNHTLHNYALALP